MGGTVEFRFSDHTLDVERRELRRSCNPVAIEPQVFDLLVCLLRNRDHVGSSRSSADVCIMSAIHPTAAQNRTFRHFSFVPIADIVSVSAL